VLVFNQDCQGVHLQEVLVIRIWRKCLSFHKIMFVRIMFMGRIIERLVYFYVHTNIPQEQDKNGPLVSLVHYRSSRQNHAKRDRAKVTILSQRII